MLDTFKCLDDLLDILYERRLKQELERTPIDIDQFLRDHSELRIHEDFKGLATILKNERYANFLEGEEYIEGSLLPYKRLMPTIKGIHFKETGGYSQSLKNAEIKDRQIKELELNAKKQSETLSKWTEKVAFWTGLMAIATSLLVLLEIVKICLGHN